MQTPHPGLGNRLDREQSRGLTLRERLRHLLLRLLGRSLPLIEDESSAPVPLDAQPYDRFQPTGLRPIDRRAAMLAAAPTSNEEGASGLHGKARPLGLFDWVLLGIEVVGAVVVAWLVFQYVYTAYFDTAPRRVSPPPASQPSYPSNGGVLRATATRTISPTATRFSEVLPPLVGTGTAQSGEAPDDGGATGAGPSASPTPALPTAMPMPTVDPQLLLPIRLRIPVMVLDSPVNEVLVNMGTWEVSALDVGHHEGTGNPGGPGNVVLAAHRDINSALFRELDRLKPGDAVYVSNSQREYRYIVQESFVVGPSHTEVMDPAGDSRVTLITCTPIGLATQRLIVTALLDDRYSPARAP